MTRRPETIAYELTPQIVLADRQTDITIRPIFDHLRFKIDSRYEVTYFPCEQFAEKSGWPGKNTPPGRVIDGNLQVTQFFESEQEHILRVDLIEGDRRTLIGDFKLYSLREDLFNRRPYKGDFHIHSARSDGREPPAYVAAACRRIGLDFMAVTDHHRYAPSIEAIRTFENVDLDLRIFPGEEVHPPENPVHMINFGGKFSVNDLFKEEAEYRRQVDRVAETLPALPPGASRYQYASCLWCFDKIREAGGMGIFCHPYWMESLRYTPSGALTSLLLDRRPFDAFELIGGFFKWEADSNTLQVARYHEERSQGRQIPIVGASDSHGCERDELFGWYYTIVFSPSLELSDLTASIKSFYSVAVEAMSNETPRAYGPFRLVKFALFLLREFFPRHDDLCLEEGRLMLRHLTGDPAAANILKTLKGRTAALQNQIWDPKP